jgi:uncharacterized membrane protein YfcA
MDPLIVVFGLGVGLLVGTTGMGGGSLMTPLLILVLGVKPVIAVGTDLAYGAVTKTVGGWQHFRRGTVDLPIAAWLSIGSIPGALGGVVVLDWLHGKYGSEFDEILLIAIAAALLVTAAAVLFRALFLPRWIEKERHTVAMDIRHKVAASAVGLGVGFVLGVTSAGSGSLIAVALIMLFRLTPRRVVGTDVFQAAILLWVAAAAHLVSGNVDLALAGNILLGSIPGVVVGTHISTRLPNAGLRPLLGLVLLGCGLAMLSKAGIDIPVAAIVGVPAAIGVVAWLLHVVRARRDAAAKLELARATAPGRAESEGQEAIARRDAPGPATL